MMSLLHGTEVAGTSDLPTAISIAQVSYGRVVNQYVGEHLFTLPMNMTVALAPPMRLAVSS